MSIKMKQKHALITGGAGFIGSHLADHLIERGFEVTLLDNLLPQVHSEDVKDLSGWPTYLNPKAHKIKGDVLSQECFAGALKGITHLVHLAASVGVGQSMSQIVDYTKNNTLAAASMLEVLAKTSHTIERIALASSMSIYGEGEYFSQKRDCKLAPPPRSVEQLKAKKWELYDEGEVLFPIPTTEQKPLLPTSIYAINKRDHEEMFLVMGKHLNIPTIALRLFNTYGSRQALTNPYTGVAAIFISRLMNDLPPLVFEDGKQCRDFVHVSDVACAFAAALESTLPIWDVFNVGSGQKITIAEMAHLLAKILKKNLQPQILQSYRCGDIRHCFADIAKLKNVLGCTPKITLEQGMQELTEWVKQCPKPALKTEECMSELKQHQLII